MRKWRLAQQQHQFLAPRMRENSQRHLCLASRTPQKLMLQHRSRFPLVCLMLPRRRMQIRQQNQPFLLAFLLQPQQTQEPQSRLDLDFRVMDPLQHLSQAVLEVPAVHLAVFSSPAPRQAPVAYLEVLCSQTVHLVPVALAPQLQLVHPPALGLAHLLHYLPPLFLAVY